MTGKRLYGIRGAVCAENDPESITRAVGGLCGELFSLNGIREAGDVVGVQFTMTPDLDALNPCTALRRAGCGIDASRLPLFCSQEAAVRGMLPRVIRVMVTAYLPEGSEVRPVYRDGAEVLRPDLGGR